MTFAFLILCRKCLTIGITKAVRSSLPYKSSEYFALTDFFLDISLVSSVHSWNVSSPNLTMKSLFYNSHTRVILISSYLLLATRFFITGYLVWRWVYVFLQDDPKCNFLQVHMMQVWTSCPLCKFLPKLCNNLNCLTFHQGQHYLLHMLPLLEQMVCVGLISKVTIS